MEKVDFVEQEQGSSIMVIYTEDEKKYMVTESAVLDFIEKHYLHVSYEYGGNDSPRNDGNPEYDIEIEVVIDPTEYLDRNFEAACELYINDQQIIHTLKQVA